MLRSSAEKCKKCTSTAASSLYKPLGMHLPLIFEKRGIVIPSTFENPRIVRCIGFSQRRNWTLFWFFTYGKLCSCFFDSADRHICNMYIYIYIYNVYWHVYIYTCFAITVPAICILCTYSIDSTQIRTCIYLITPCSHILICDVYVDIFGTVIIGFILFRTHFPPNGDVRIFVKNSSFTVFVNKIYMYFDEHMKCLKWCMYSHPPYPLQPPVSIMINDFKQSDRLQPFIQVCSIGRSLNYTRRSH